MRLGGGEDVLKRDGTAREVEGRLGELGLHRGRILGARVGHEDVGRAALDKPGVEVRGAWQEPTRLVPVVIRGNQR